MPFNLINPEVNDYIIFADDMWLVYTYLGWEIMDEDKVRLIKDFAFEL